MDGGTFPISLGVMKLLLVMGAVLVLDKIDERQALLDELRWQDDGGRKLKMPGPLYAPPAYYDFSEEEVGEFKGEPTEPTELPSPEELKDGHQLLPV